MKKSKEKMFPQKLFITRDDEGEETYFLSHGTMEEATNAPDEPAEYVAIYELADVHLVHSEVRHESVKNPEVKS